MTFTVLLIAGVPALAVFIVGALTQSKGKTVVAAVLAALLGIMTGNPAYSGVDVGAVVIALLLAWPGLNAAAARRREAEKPAAAAPTPVSGAPPAPPSAPAPAIVSSVPIAVEAPAASTPSPAAPSGILAFVVLMILLAFGVAVVTGSRTSAPSQAPVAAAPAVPASIPAQTAPAAITPAPAPHPEKRVASAKRSATVSTSAKHPTTRDCMRLASDQAMASCLEGARD